MIWLLEAVKDWEKSALRLLVANWPLRWLNSLDALRLAMRDLNPDFFPKCLCVHGESITPSERDSLYMQELPNLVWVSFAQGKDAVYLDSSDIDGSCARLRRFLPDDSRMRWHDIRLDPKAAVLYVDGGFTIHLSPKENSLLQIFLQDPDRSWSRADLERRLWSGRPLASRTVDSHISRLRTKLAPSEVSISRSNGYHLVHL